MKLHSELQSSRSTDALYQSFEGVANTVVEVEPNLLDISPQVGL